MTPPIGWNSWDCFGATVTEAQVRSQATVMAKELKQFGWKYVVVDIQWYEPHAKGHEYRQGAELCCDAYGRLQPAPNRFPSAEGGRGFAPLAKDVHALGLKFGVHLMRGIPKQCVNANTPVWGGPWHAQDIADRASTCPWNPDMYGVDMSKPGAQAYYDSVFKQLADWGVDFVKVDDIARPYHEHEAEIEGIRRAIDDSGHPMVLSLSPGETALDAADHVSRHANMWRISDDFWDAWPQLVEQFARCDKWSPSVGSGHFPDADMLPLGYIRFGEPTNFTHDEQRTMMTLWAIFRSPLMLGCDLEKLDEWTRSLITNQGVIRVNQEGSHPEQIFREGTRVAWRSVAERGDAVYLALFNLSDTPDTFGFSAERLGVKPMQTAKDLWSGAGIEMNGAIHLDVPPHGSRLVSLIPSSLPK